MALRVDEPLHQAIHGSSWRILRPAAGGVHQDWARRAGKSTHRHADHHDRATRRTGITE
jgi:hypothetical protein